MAIAWLVIAVVIGAATAAGATAAYFATTAPATTGSCASAPPPGNLTITDDLGRCVSVPFDPARVAVLSPSIMDPVFRLGLRSHVVAIDCYAQIYGGIGADYSDGQIAEWNLSQSMCVQVGPSFVLEDLANATPRLVLASTIVSVQAVAEIGASLGVPVVMLQPATISGVLTDVTLLGEIFGVSSRAASLEFQLHRSLDNASEALSSHPPFPSVLVTYDTDSNGYWTFGAGTFGSSLLALAGGMSISADNSNPYPELPAETVLAADPQVVVYGTGFGLNLSFYQTGPEWSSIPAVQAGHFYGIDSNFLTEPDPTMILEGLPALLGIFHP